MIFRKNKITRVPQSLIAKYFDGEEVYVPITYDVISRFFIFDEAACSEIKTIITALDFLESDGYKDVVNNNINPEIDLVNDTKVLLRNLGIYNEFHYKVEWNPEYGRYRFIWNDEFVMKYAD